MNGGKVSEIGRWLAFTISTLYFGLILLEFILSLNGRSLCSEKSCTIISSITGSEKEMLLAGMVYFGTLSVLLALGRFSIAALLSLSGLSAEIVFLMRQALEYHTWCSFCLIIAAGVVAVAVLSFALVKPSLNEVVISGSMIGSFILAFLLTSIPLEPIRQNKVLIYSPSCPHCKRVIQFCKEQGIELSLCRETNVRGILYCLGVRGVPALLVREKDSVRIIEGERDVIAYLSQRRQKEAVFPFPAFDQENGICSVEKKCR